MSDFEAYSDELLLSSKQFLEDAKSLKIKSLQRQRALRASLTHAFFFLEAQINYLAAHFAKSPEFNVLEQSLLSEKDVSLAKGRFVLTDKAKFFRLEDRIEFLLSRFSSHPEKAKGTWFSDLKSSISVRNRLVHPREAHTLEFSEVERTILSVLGCLSALYDAIFGKKFPLAALGLHTGPKES